MQCTVILCSHNPRPDYLRRTLEGLKKQSLPPTRWEFLLVDNGSTAPLASSWDLSWHPNARHVREDELGLTPARLRGIKEARGDLLVFVDDDNILESNYLEVALSVPEKHPHLGVYGAGVLKPEFEEEPDPILKPWLRLLALRTAPRTLWTNNSSDYSCAPHGAGLCVTHRVALRYAGLVNHLRATKVLDRRGESLFCGGDDLFSWLSADWDIGFGIFEQLRITHLISAGRVRRDYIVRMVHGHTFSHLVLNYLLKGKCPSPITMIRRLRLITHGFRFGWFSLRCEMAEVKGQTDAVRFIRDKGLETLPAEINPFLKAETV